MKRLTGLLAALVLALSLVSLSPASAAEPASAVERVSKPDPTGGLSKKEFADGYRDLVSALQQSGATTSGGEVSYDVAAFGAITLGVPAAGTGGDAELGGGWDGWRGPYVSFNRVDQGALLAGGSAALAAAICFIPAVGQAACVVAVALVAAAFYYLTEYGRCSTSRPNLRVYVWSRSTGCYS